MASSRKILHKGWVLSNIYESTMILDNLRKPINSTERYQRINGKDKSELYPYYGATGQVGYIDNFLIDGEYVLLGEDGAPFLDPYKNKAYIIKGKSWVNNHAHILKAFGSNSYLCYYLNQINYSDFVTGTTRLKLNQYSMRNIPVKLAPIPEQHRIVAKLEELFSQLDSAVAALKKAKEQIKTYKQSVLSSAFSGRLGMQNVECKMNEETGLPEGWKWVKINFLAENNKNSIKAGPFGSSLKKDCYVEMGYKIYGQEQVISGNPSFGNYYVDLEKYQELESCQIKPFDILISLVGTVGKVLILPENCTSGIINPRLIKISINRNIYSPIFFKYYFESNFLKNQYSLKTHGATMDVLNLGILKYLEFPFCSLVEQEQIVSEIELRFSEADNLEKTIDMSLEQAESLRQSILKKAFEGRLVPQDENDEPASLLLERIKKEKLTINNSQLTMKKRKK